MSQQDQQPGTQARELVDWEDAAQIAGRLASPGPVASRHELEALVASLRGAAARAVDPVLEITRMTAADGRDLSATGLSGVLVLDRPGWARASARSMQSMTAGALRLPTRTVPLAAELVASAEVGATLALLSTKILGQFDPFGPADGNLLLVAPNVLQTERDLRVRPEDFRLWVCLHEQTHALQTAAAPWIADHLRAKTQTLLADLSTSTSDLRQAPARLLGAARAVVSAVRGTTGPDGQTLSLVDGVLTPTQRQALDEVGAVMALLEGHADVAMDAVGSSVVPTVRSIRRKFSARRSAGGTSTPDRVLRRLLGMDAKMAQYRDGAAFVRGVTRVVGTDGVNAVWSGPDALPSPREIADPVAWVRRVHG